MRWLPAGRLPGFTLIDLLVGILVVSSLMAVALPAYVGAVTDMRNAKECRANMQVIASAEVAYGMRVHKRQFVAVKPGCSVVKAGLTELQATPKCPCGGQYSVNLDEHGKGTFTVHCSLRSHDYSRDPIAGFTMGLNSQ